MRSCQKPLICFAIQKIDIGCIWVACVYKCAFAGSSWSEQKKALIRRQFDTSGIHKSILPCFLELSSPEKMETADVLLQSAYGKEGTRTSAMRLPEATWRLNSGFFVKRPQKQSSSIFTTCSVSEVWKTSSGLKLYTIRKRSGTFFSIGRSLCIRKRHSYW